MPVALSKSDLHSRLGAISRKLDGLLGCGIKSPAHSRGERRGIDFRRFLAGLENKSSLLQLLVFE